MQSCKNKKGNDLGVTVTSCLETICMNVANILISTHLKGTFVILKVIHNLNHGNPLQCGRPQTYFCTYTEVTG